MSGSVRSGQRRGLGRGLGSLIPTAPPEPEVQPDEGESPEQPTTGRRGGPRARESGTTPSAGAAGRTPGARGAGTVRSRGKGPAPRDVAEVDEARADESRLPEGLAPVPGAWFAELPVEQVVPNAVQPRQVFDEDALAELEHSIREVGLLQPVVVRRAGPSSYELVMGERRWRASQRAGLTTIPAIVRETDDDAMLRDALLENLHRAQLNPLEEASAYQQLLEDFGCTHEELAARIGRSRPQISNMLRLLRLGPAVQRRVAAGVLSAGHARALLTVDDPATQDRLAQRVVAEGISVRGLEEIVAVGVEREPVRRPRAGRREAAPEVTAMAERLGDRLDTRVSIDVGRAKGRIVVEFAGAEDLQRIIEVLDPRNRTDRVI